MKTVLRQVDGLEFRPPRPRPPRALTQEGDLATGFRGSCAVRTYWAGLLLLDEVRKGLATDLKIKYTIWHLTGAR